MEIIFGNKVEPENMQTAELEVAEASKQENNLMNRKCLDKT